MTDIIQLSRYLEDLPPWSRHIGMILLVRRLDRLDSFPIAANYAIQTEWKDGDCPDWLSAILGGNPQMLEEVTDEALLLLSADAEEWYERSSTPTSA